MQSPVVHINQVPLYSQDLLQLLVGTFLCMLYVHVCMENCGDIHVHVIIVPRGGGFAWGKSGLLRCESKIVYLISETAIASACTRIHLSPGFSLCMYGCLVLVYYCVLL